MSDWVVLGRAADRWIGYAMQGDKLVAQASGAGTAAVLAQLEHVDAPMIRVGDGPASDLPAPVLPETGNHLPALNQSKPPDVVSGWVRLWIAGFLATRPDWDGVICAVHGDVTHWLHVSAGEVVSMQSSLTPRMAEQLGFATADLNEDAASDSLSRPERLAVQLRVADVSGQPGAGLGHLIGAELAAMRAYWLGQQIGVIGQGALAQAYRSALEAQHVPVEMSAPDDLMQHGLAALGKALKIAR